MYMYMYIMHIYILYTKYERLTNMSLSNSHTGGQTLAHVHVHAHAYIFCMSGEAGTGNKKVRVGCSLISEGQNYYVIVIKPHPGFVIINY